MGVLLDKRIQQSRIWHDPDATTSIPSFDYDYVYPKTVYDAISATMDTGSTTLTDEIAAIYREIATKQNLIEGGTAGNLMVWSGIKGQIASLEVAKYINSVAADRVNTKIPTEKAVGDWLASYVTLADFTSHISDTTIHITDTERNRWESMTPSSTFEAHSTNSIIHITDAERALWNSKADGEIIDNHVYNYSNPHQVTAHQVGAYTREETDLLIENIRESFFNYKNVYWDDRNYTAQLVTYHASNWNPNYILSYGAELPDVDDGTATYFALIPETDYSINETDRCIIWAKVPGLMWQEVGSCDMEMGDMVIIYPSTTMYIWVQGHWKNLFSTSVDGTNGSDGSDGSNGTDGSNGLDGASGYTWRPEYDDAAGTLTFSISNDYSNVGPFIIKGADGYTPVKGVDYFDGANGEGVPIGGMSGEILVKLSNDNFDTAWRSINGIFDDLIDDGGELPETLITWDGITGRPEWYDELGTNTDGFITQRAATYIYDEMISKYNEVMDALYGNDGSGLSEVSKGLEDHLDDFNNPHRVTAALIGAATSAQHTDHITNYNNPHNVTKSQIGLGYVDNTSDTDKPISTAVQEVLDELSEKVAVLGGDSESLKFIADCTWKDDYSKLTFTFNDGAELDVKIPITDMFASMWFDSATKDLVIELLDGTQNRIDISNLIVLYTGVSSDNITVSVNSKNEISAVVLPSTITGNELVSSIELRGYPTATTQSVADRSTRIATTEFVANQVIDNLISYEADRPLSANMGRVLNETKMSKDAVVELIEQVTGITVVDNLESTNPYYALSANMGRELDLTKAPRIHTSDSGSTYGRATISLFGHVRASEVDPLMDGTLNRGTDDGRYARADHRHPTDITRAPIHWPDVGLNQYEMTGEPKAVTPPDDSNNTRIVTTEWVRRNAVGVHKGWCASSGMDPIKEVFLLTDYAGFVPDDVLDTYTTAITFSLPDATESISTFSSSTVPVSGITGLVNEGTVGEVYVFKGVVSPSNATEQQISYEIMSGSLGGAYIQYNSSSGNHEIHGVTEEGTLEIMATVENGLSDGSGDSSGGDGGSTGGDGGSTGGDSGSSGDSSGSDTSTRGDVVYHRCIGSAVAVTFKESDLTASLTSTMLNVNGTGAARITYGGYTLSADMIKAYHTYLFIWDGRDWKLMNPSAIHPLEPDDVSNSMVSSKWVIKNTPSVRFAETCTTAGNSYNKVVTLLPVSIESISTMSNVSTVSSDPVASISTMSLYEEEATAIDDSSNITVRTISSPIGAVNSDGEIMSTYDASVTSSNVDVSYVSGLPSKGTVGEDLELTYSILPLNATNNGVNFTITSGGTGASIVEEDGRFKITNVQNEGEIQVMMTVVDGLSSGSTEGDGGSTGGDGGSTDGDGGSTGGDSGSTGGSTEPPSWDPPTDKYEDDDTSSFVLTAGATIAVPFKYEDSNTSNTKTCLTVNGIGPIPVWNKSTTLTNGMIGESYTHWFTYDGAGHWHIINPVASVIDSGGVTFP